MNESKISKETGSFRNPYHSKISYQANVTLLFADFSLTYLGINNVLTTDGRTVTLQTKDFLVVDENNQEIIVKIGPSQLPAKRPTDFTVNRYKYTIWTHTAPNESISNDLELVITQTTPS